MNRKMSKNVTDARCASGRFRAPIRFEHFSELKTPEKRPHKLADKQTPTAPHCNASADAAPTSAFRFGPKTPLANRHPDAFHTRRKPHFAPPCAQMGFQNDLKMTRTHCANSGEMGALNAVIRAHEGQGVQET